MRRLVLLLFAAGAFSQVASAASGDPSTYVLRANDVPAHYDLDKDNSQALPKAFLGTNAERRRLLDRVGYVNGYVVRYLNSDPPRWRYVSSQAFVFRTAKGASIFLAWIGKSMRGGVALRPAAGLGDEGWSFVSHSSEVGAVVGWRSGRVVGLVGCQYMTARRALALTLARQQQRHVEAARR